MISLTVHETMVLIQLKIPGCDISSKPFVLPLNSEAIYAPLTITSPPVTIVSTLTVTSPPITITSILTITSPPVTITSAPITITSTLTIPGMPVTITSVNTVLGECPPPTTITSYITITGVNSSLKTEDLGDYIDVYPNPSYGLITITKPDWLDIKSIDLIDSKGQLVHTLDYSHLIDLTRFKGLYLLHLMDSKGTIIESQKLIIQ